MERREEGQAREQGERALPCEYPRFANDAEKSKEFVWGEDKDMIKVMVVA
jgi:hypothetical protein